MVPARVSRAEIGTAFAGLAETLADDSDIETYLTVLCRHGVRLTGAECAVLVYVTGPARPGGPAGVVASDERGAALAGSDPYAEDEPWAGCLRSQEIITVADLGAHARSWPRFTTAAASARLTALTLIPVSSRGARAGGLALLGSRLPDVAEILLALALANAAGAGLTVTAELSRQRTAATQLQSALTSRVVIEQAKGVLAERWRVSPDEAFVTLRGHARATRQNLTDVATAVVGGSLAPVRDADVSRPSQA